MIMAEIRTEILHYEAYYRSVKTEKRVITILEHGARLRLFLLEAKRSTEVQVLETELFEVFVKHISVSHSRQTILGQFFSICLHHVSEDHYDEVIIRLATEAVLEHTDNGRFSDAYDLALLIHRYIHMQSGFRTQANVFIGFNLSLYLAGRRTKVCGETKVYNSMIELSRIILREALEGSRHVADFAFTDMDVSQIEELVILLGQHENYEDLEVSIKRKHIKYTHANLILAHPHTTVVLAHGAEDMVVLGGRHAGTPTHRDTLQPRPPRRCYPPLQGYPLQSYTGLGCSGLYNIGVHRPLVGAVHRNKPVR